MLFLACRSVRNTLLKILVHVPGPQTWLPIAKIHNFDFQIEILSRPWKWKVGLPNNFLRYFGMYLTPPDSQNMKKKIFGVPQNFSKIAPEVPWFRYRRYSETSTRYSKTSTENGLVFLGLKNKPFQNPTKMTLKLVAAKRRLLLPGAPGSNKRYYYRLFFDDRLFFERPLIFRKP